MGSTEGGLGMLKELAVEEDTPPMHALPSWALIFCGGIAVSMGVGAFLGALTERGFRQAIGGLIGALILGLIVGLGVDAWITP